MSPQSSLLRILALLTLGNAAASGPAAPPPAAALEVQPTIGGRPLFADRFTADPAALVTGDRLYVYAGHDDAKDGEFFTMPGWLAYSTRDMTHWTPHGYVMKSEDFSFARRNSAWASQMVERAGKFYFYTTVQMRDSDEHAIAVAVGDSPLGPFADARGTPLVRDAMTTDSRRPNADIDPTVFVDDDGTPWMAWGNGDCYIAKLSRSMVALDGPITKLALRNYAEGPWIFKRGSLYYNVYAAETPGVAPEQIGYSTAPSIGGPWTYRGLVTGPARTGFTIHPAIVRFGGRWRFFYHDGSTPVNGIKGNDVRRSVGVETLRFTRDGRIVPIVQPGATTRTR